MSKSNRPERRGSGSTPPARRAQGGSQPQAGSSRQRAGGAATPPGARPTTPQRRGAPPQPPRREEQSWYIWVALLVPLAALLIWFVWPKDGGSVNVGTPPVVGGPKQMVIETDKGRIVARLYTEESAGVAKTIANFESKANAGTFDGRVFHRVEDWVIQGGDPLGNGTGGGDMPSEYNQLPFKVGSLGVARGQDPAINNDSQFFIVKQGPAAAGLTGQYTNFGEVIEGMEVANSIAMGDKMNRVTVVAQP